MAFAQTLTDAMGAMLPQVLLYLFLPVLPFVVAEQIWPVGKRPEWRDYGLNLLISVSGAYLSLPAGLAAAVWSAQLRHILPWHPFSFTFHSINAVPIVGPALALLAMICVPLLLHDMWFYWAHRIEHKVPLLWAFHRIHHSDDCMNASTWARDNFLQTSWRSFFSIFTLGCFVDLDFVEAGEAALYSSIFLTALSLLYHSALRIRLPWLDRIIVTPQVHRIHHAVDPTYHNKNFADALPLFDILFGTYHRPARHEFPSTGLGSQFPAPQSFWSAQFGPLLALSRLALQRGRKRDTPSPNP